jgi:5'-methylthioadenosine phosphorylase
VRLGSELAELLGIIGGTGFKEFSLELREKKSIKTPYGPPSSDILFYEHKGKTLCCLIRHGEMRNIPPHMVNHKANIFALHLAGATKVIGLNSVGALRKDLPLPSIVLPDDYINFDPPTFFDSQIRHVVPELSSHLRSNLIESAKDLGLSVIEKGVYVQTKGPRMETPAEIRVISKWGDVVGMNAASEATLAKEKELEFCSICSIDNMANGLGEGPPNYQEILATSQQNQKKIEDILLRYIEVYL